MLTVPARVWVLDMAMRRPPVSPVVAFCGWGLTGCGCGMACTGLGATFSGFFLSGMGIAVGSEMGAAFSLATGGGAGGGVSVARTLSALVGCRWGRGMALTIVAWMVLLG